MERDAFMGDYVEGCTLIDVKEGALRFDFGERVDVVGKAVSKTAC